MPDIRNVRMNVVPRFDLSGLPEQIYLTGTVNGVTRELNLLLEVERDGHNLASMKLSYLAEALREMANACHRLDRNAAEEGKD